MNALNLPEPVAAYFDADRHDARAVARCFSANAVVKDEGQTHAGHAAIEAWKAAASARYTCVVEPHTQTVQDRRCIVTSRVSGNFPGSPVDLRYDFTLERGRIAALEIKV